MYKQFKFNFVKQCNNMINIMTINQLLYHKSIIEDLFIILIKQVEKRAFTLCFTSCNTTFPTYCYDVYLVLASKLIKIKIYAHCSAQKYNVLITSSFQYLSIFYIYCHKHVA